MNTESKICEELITHLSKCVLIDFDNIIVWEDASTLKETALAFPITHSDAHLVFTIANDRNIFLATLTDGDIDDVVSILLDLNEADFKAEWGKAVTTSYESLNRKNIYGLFFSRVRYYELFHSIKDSFRFLGKEYTIKAVIFLSKKEIETYINSEDEFYELIGEKDMVKFEQVK
ncbi:hypothetical protein [Shewanella pealeana]|uniref:Uncharacterized protein n=1 Tax=Shewanella pealeana (strain ATCC 700345 / ANG-SQ1) TaxID=398579 RepID=A8H802_SHEPA|nr:hypothetical protein [Shewanella pealeana]ABV88689.1 hypothetical protein Spea_3375 [Shewanella pealeana ATCC 700345]